MSAPTSRLSAKPRFERYPFTLGVAQRSELAIRIGLSERAYGSEFDEATKSRIIASIRAHCA